ncbi:ABC-2 type transport system permease protein [Ruminococcaceae bacterium BL-6]|nr:ABC-2 type transport system permease protein [Ruminococcaceae bacterium BL-6]
MLRILSSDWLKTKRTAYRTISFLLPPSVAVVALWYLSVHRRTAAFQANAYVLFFDLWTILIPILAGLLAGILCSQEEQAGHFNGLLGVSIPRVSIFTGKLLLLILTTAATLFVSLILFVGGLAFLLHVSGLRTAVFLEGALLTVLGSLFLCVLHLWLSFAFGMGASVSVGGAGFLIAAICGLTSAGNRIWRFLPWTWPARLSQIPVPFSHFESSSGGDWAGMLPAILLFVLSLICAFVWFNRWEGRRSYE